MRLSTPINTACRIKVYDKDNSGRTVEITSDWNDTNKIHITICEKKVCVLASDLQRAIKAVTQ